MCCLTEDTIGDIASHQARAPASFSHLRPYYIPVYV